MEGSAKKRRISKNEGMAGGPFRTHTSTEGHKMVAPSRYEYEVFLSFRGPDTRSGFTDFLYTSLNDARIRTFKDDEELRVGEEFAPELLQAINQSKILIPIFSKGYASSAWCLKELVRMVECQKTGRQKIMPIFYDVAPSEVRYQNGGFGAALLVHENKKRCDEETIKEWKAALSAVGNISGWDLHSESPRREGAFAKKLTEEVFKELKKAYLAVTNSLVNVDKHVDAIIEMIDAQTSETRIIGIHGMGGIGKTTIAKLIYNKLSHNFENCCFLGDIRETSKVKGIPYVQSRLISDILKTKCTDIEDIDEGTQTIKDKLSNKRVLLLLDDVEEEDHIDALVGKRDWLGNGSKIIVTTRKKDVLDIPEVDSSYELSVMDSDQSLQLFSKHAFRRDSPLEEDMDQSKRAIGIAGGLPLALEVIGSLLCRTKKEMWDDQLKELESIPHDKVLNKLKISYDALKFRQKRIFLDIACFFIGHNKNILMHFWDEYDFFPKQAITVLENMSLIKINQDNEVWMHDQLRDLGREMVRQSSEMKIEKQSRVWNPKVGLDLLTRHKGKKEVEALRLRLDCQQMYHFTYEGFQDLSSLRFLEVILGGSVENICVGDRLRWHESASDILATNENSRLLPKLRWLSWKNIPPTFNITNFSLDEVVILNLSYSKITDDWNGWSHMDVMKKLKSLNLSYCENFRRLPNNWGSNLTSLEYLYLQECKSLEMLPATIGNLESLIELNISDTSIKELPDSIGNLKNLKVVKMQWVYLRKIPDAFWTIDKFEEIRVGELFSTGKIDARIGDGIYRNQSLRILRLTGASIHALPPRLPESLIELELDALRTGMFPDLSNLINLEELVLVFYSYFNVNYNPDGFVGDPMPRWIGSLSKLESLSLEFYCETAPPTDISLPPRLKWLHLYGIPDLRCLPKLPSSLSSLHLENEPRRMEDVMEDESSLSISEGDLPQSLEELEIYRFKHLYTLPDLSSLIGLREVGVISCANLVEIQGELPQSLDKLTISCCESLKKLPDLSCLKKLRWFYIQDCTMLEVEAVLGSSRRSQANLWENLQDLLIYGHRQWKVLPDLSDLRKLTCLHVQNCGDLVEIQGELPQSLTALEIVSCRSLEKLPDLSSLNRLRRVEIRRCDKLNVEAISSRCSERVIWNVS